MCIYAVWYFRLPFRRLTHTSLLLLFHILHFDYKYFMLAFRYTLCVTTDYTMATCNRSVCVCVCPGVRVCVCAHSGV